MPSITGILRRAARKVGVEVTRYPPPGSLASHLQRLLALHRINLVLDVGAHEGGYARLLRGEAGYAGEIVSFEPASATFARLQAAMAADPRWRAHRYALGAARGHATLRLFPDSELNSLHEPSAYGVLRYPSMREGGVELVEVRRLDEVFAAVASHVPDPRVLLKVDAQGADLEVLEGAAGVLDRILAVQLEVPVKPIYQAAPPLPEALERVTGLGYEVTGLFPVSRERDGVGLTTLDCVARRTAARLS